MTLLSGSWRMRRKKSPKSRRAVKPLSMKETAPALVVSALSKCYLVSLYPTSSTFCVYIATLITTLISFMLNVLECGKGKPCANGQKCEKGICVLKNDSTRGQGKCRSRFWLISVDEIASRPLLNLLCCHPNTHHHVDFIHAQCSRMQCRRRLRR